MTPKHPPGPPTTLGNMREQTCAASSRSATRPFRGSELKTCAVDRWGSSHKLKNRACHLRQAQLFPVRLWGVGAAIEHSLQLSFWVEELPHNQQSSSRSKLKFGMD
jgi:hypothetical protein